MPIQVDSSIGPTITASIPNTTVADGRSSDVSSPVAIKAASGFTSTEGVDMLTYNVSDDGIYLVYCAITLVVASNSDGAHVCSGYADWTCVNGFHDSGPIGVNGYNATLNLKGTPGADSGGSVNSVKQIMPIAAKKGTTIVLRVSSTNAGTDATAGTYYVNFAVTKA